MLGHYFRKDGDYGYMLFQAGIGTHSYNTRRGIEFIERTAQNQHSAFLLTGHVETGLRYRNSIFNLAPFAGLQYTGLLREGFTEHGAGSLNLTADHENYHVFRPMFGVRFDSVPFRLRNGLASFYGNVAWMYEFEATRRQSEFTARFTEAGMVGGQTMSSFTVRGNDPGRDWVQAGFGLNYDVNRNLRGFAGYDAYANQRQVLHSANLGFVYQR
jgi:outer membrane autotransporter protein